MKRKLLWTLAVVVVLGFAGAFFASPFLAAQSLVRAARAGDAAGIERHVDFPAFRQSLKDELSARLLAEFGGERRGGALGSLGMLLAPQLVAGAVDSFVTPQGVAALVREGEAPNPQSRAEDTPQPDMPQDASGDDVRQSWAYRDLNTFAVTLTRESRPDDPLVLLMQRRGPFSWKLAGIDLTPAS